MADDSAARGPRVSVIIPVHNEGSETARVCAEVRRALAPLGREAAEIIVVDDASSDGALRATPEGADRLVTHKRQVGYGGAIRSGFHHARGAIIVIIDADGTYDPAYIPRLIEAMTPGVAMVVGARTGASVHIPALRRPAKWLLTRLANYLSGVRIPDLNSGLRAIDRAVFEEYLRLLPMGFSLTTTLTLACLCDGRDVEFIPIDYAKRREGASKIRPWRDTRQMLLTILRTVTYFNPLKIFLPASLALGLAALAVLVGSALHGRVLDGTVSVLTLTAIQCFAFGLLADAITRTGRARRH